MPITLAGQAPGRLDALWALPPAGPVDPARACAARICAAGIVPAAPGSEVSAQETGPAGAPVALSRADVEEAVAKALGPLADPVADWRAKQLLAQGLEHWCEGESLSFRELFVAEALGRLGLPAPGPRVAYQAGVDVCDPAGAYLAGRAPFGALFAGLGAFARPRALGYAFDSAGDWAGFQAWARSQLPALAPLVPRASARALDRALSMALAGPVEALVLRDPDCPGEDDWCLARLLPALLSEYAAQVAPDTCHVMAFDALELAWPSVLCLVDVSATAAAGARRVASEWSAVAAAIEEGPRVVSASELRNLSEEARRAAGPLDSTKGGPVDRVGDTARSADEPFLTSAPTSAWTVRRVRAISARMGRVDRSDNARRARRPTFARPNRRDPDDWDRKGSMSAAEYRPDVHVYLDTSGSIDEAMYASACRCCIRIAKELGVSLYVTSFASQVGPTAKLHTATLSTKGAYRELVRMPKVTGGTDFANVWSFIEADPKRRRELSVMVTDLAWSPMGGRARHPARLYYAPVVPDGPWSEMVDQAGRFCDAMRRHEPDIRRRILM